jgi:hypothetical protein
LGGWWRGVRFGRVVAVLLGACVEEVAECLVVAFWS